MIRTYSPSEKCPEPRGGSVGSRRESQGGTYTSGQVHREWRLGPQSTTSQPQHLYNGLILLVLIYLFGFRIVLALGVLAFKKIAIDLEADLKRQHRGEERGGRRSRRFCERVEVIHIE